MTRNMKVKSLRDMSDLMAEALRQLGDINALHNNIDGFDVS